MMWSRSHSFVMSLCAIIALTASTVIRAADAPAGRWSADRAKAWYAAQPWLIGCDFIPSTADNQLEMWQAATFDPDTIDRELGYAQSLGFNTARVFLHDLAWQADREGFKHRLDQFLTIAAKHHIRPLLVFFDDCWNAHPKVGPQPEPTPGVHNSQWVQSPGRDVVNDPSQWPRLHDYVTDVLKTFGRDRRILAWDLYNEPGNSGQVGKSMGLLRAVFDWARSANPQQPLTVGTWNHDKAFDALNEFQLSHSDIISFHNYGHADDLAREIESLKKLGRPVICTEYMRRPVSTFAGSLPVFHREHVGCYNWGLVSGRTQTIYPWGSKPGSPEPNPWFHDILHPDGSAYNAAEVQLIRSLARPGS